MGSTVSRKGDPRTPGAEMTTIDSEHHSQRSALTVLRATGKSRGVLTQIETANPDPSEYRVGSFHVPAGRASTVPTLDTPNGTAR